MNNTFSYTYSAKDNKEIQEIKRKYLPEKENKFEELKKLDNMVQASGVIESLCLGIGGALVFGLGFCLAAQIIGNGILTIILGVILGIAGIAEMFVAYPLYRKIFKNTKEKYTPRILELTTELTGEKISSN